MSPILFWLLAHGARPRRHDAAFVVVAVVVRYFGVYLIAVAVLDKPKKRFRVHFKKE